MYVVQVKKIKLCLHKIHFIHRRMFTSLGLSITCVVCSDWMCVACPPVPVLPDPLRKITELKAQRHEMNIFLKAYKLHSHVSEYQRVVFRNVAKLIAILLKQDFFGCLKKFS